MKYSQIALLVLSALFFTPTESIDIVSRSVWGARAPKTPSGNLDVNPPEYVVIHHSNGTSCTSKNACITKVKNFQIEHMTNRNFNDIGYNFLVGEDGNIYEGLGWGKHGSHAVLFNGKSIGICVIGTYTNSPPNNAALQAVKDLIEFGVQQGKISSTYKILGHKQITGSTCPGKALFNEVKHWPNWLATSECE